MNLKHPFILNLFALATFGFTAAADPQLTSWLTAYSGQYARVYATTSARSSGTSSTTWSGQVNKAYADIEQISYSSSYVYVQCPDLASYVMGPWLNPQGGQFMFWPTNQHNISKFPRNPTAATGAKTFMATGTAGNYVNGVIIFNALDGKAWNNVQLVSGPHTKPAYFWHRNAPVGEGFNFDYALGHQNPSGVYHTHQNPIALRYELGDHVDYDPSTKNYSESTNAVTKHSPILGWSFDGYPIYGPYGYSVSNNASSGVRRMVGGYVVRDGSTSGVDNVTNNPGIIPAWYARFRQAHFGGAYSTTAGTNRPTDISTYPVGTFAEDYSYLADLTNGSTGKAYVQGTDFDLDQYNGRWCVTPEFPGGTYAYFISIDSSNNATYPYVFGYEYYGNVTGGTVNSISEAVTTNFMGGPDTPITLSVPTYNSTNSVVTLVWTSVEGGTYAVDSSTNQTVWSNENTNVVSQGLSTTTNYISIPTSGTAYARITRTALATFDDASGYSGSVAQAATQAFALGNTAPTVANPIANQTAAYSAAFSFTFSSNTFTDADVGQTLTYAAFSSMLTNSGISFNSATRTFSASTVDAASGGTIAGSYIVQVVATDNGSPAKCATNSFTLTIYPAAASVTPAAATRTYGAVNPAFTGSVTGFVAADSITANYATTATTNSGVGTYSITATVSDPGSRLGNYTITTNAGTLTVTKAVLQVSADTKSRAYGTTNPLFTVTYSGFTDGQTLGTSGVTGSPSLATAAATNSPVGAYVITNSIGTLAAANYSFMLANGTLMITQAALSVTASNASRTYGVMNPVFGGILTGVVNNDNITASYTSSATTNSSAGSYTIVPTLSDPGNRLANYSVTTNTGTLTISKAVLSVSADAKTRAYGAANPPFTVTYSGFVNGETASSGTISGSPALTTGAATNSTLGSYTITNAIGTLASADYIFTLINGTLTVTQAMLTVTANNVSRGYGATNSILTGTISGLANNDNITANYSTAATAGSVVGTYPITVTLNDPDARLGNYLVTTNVGTLTVTNLSGSANAIVSLTLSNSVLSLITNGTQNYTFTDPNSGLAAVVAVTILPYSSSNATPAFTLLDTFGPNGGPVHAAVDSGLADGDGNWVDYFEGVNFSASLVSASSSIATNSIRFEIADLGLRPGDSDTILWTSTATTNSWGLGPEGDWPLDTNSAPLAEATYTGQLRTISSTGQYQLSDLVTGGYGLILSAQFTEGSVTGSAAILDSTSLANNQLQFSVAGTTGATYVVQEATNLVSPTWVAVYTNIAPFTFTAGNASSWSQRFFRVVSP